MIDKFIESRSVRITVTRAHAKVESTGQLPPRLLKIEVDYQGQRETESFWNPCGASWSIYAPPGRDLDMTRCDIRVRIGAAILCEWKGGGKLIIQQSGWIPCVACSDTKLRQGQMWVGKSRAGIDEWIQCVACRGVGAVPLLKYFDPHTGLEIDYERQQESLLVV